MATRHKRESVKLRFKVTLVSAGNLPEGVQACVSWKRGGKGENAGVTKTVPVKNGTAEWNHSVIILGTLFRNATGYEEKYMAISICEDKGRRKSTLGKTKINLAEYGSLAGSSESRVLQVPKKLSRHTIYTLNIKIVSESLGISGDDEQTDVHCEDDPGSDDDGKAIDFARYDDPSPAPTPASTTETSTTSSASATAFGDPNGSQGSSGSNTLHSSSLRQTTPSLPTPPPSALALHLAASGGGLNDSGADQTVVKELRALVLSLTSERDEWKEQLTKSKNMKHSLRNDSKYKQELAERKKENSSLQEQLDLVTKDRDKLIKAQASLMIELQEKSADAQIIAKMRSQMEESAKDRDTLQEKLRKAAAKKSSNKEVLVSTEQQLAIKEQEIQDLKRSYEAEIMKLNTEIQSSQAKEDSFRKQARSLDEIQALREKNSQLEGRVKELEAKLQESEECVQSLVRQREELKKQREELKEQLKLPSTPSGSGTPNPGHGEAALLKVAEQELAEAHAEIEKLTKKLSETKNALDDKSKMFTADLKKLKEENDALRKTRSQSPMTTVLEAEVKKLKDENDFLKRTKAPSFAQASFIQAGGLRKSGGTKKPMTPKLDEEDEASVPHEVLLWQIQVYEMIQRVFFHVDKPNFGTSPIPLTAISVLDKLLDRDCFETPDEFFFHAICSAIESTSRVHMNNELMSLYWLTTTWHLVQGVHEKLTGDQQPIPDVERLYILQSADREPEEPRIKFLYQLQHLLFTQYMQAVQRTQKALEPLVIHSILESETAYLQRPSARRPRQKSDTKTIIGILSEVLQNAVEAHMPDSVCLQFFCQILFWINTLVFNHLISHPELCTCRTGFQIRLGLSRLDEFVTTHGPIKLSRVFLNHCVQAANLMVIDKSIVLDPAIRGTILNALNVAQIAALVLSFKAESNFPESGVSDDVIIEMKKVQAAARDSVLLEVSEFIVPQF
ncbi:hypothetical protein Pelo_1634 [Pelomyxa schiedti]|nr:hypothetical protein Pelo_1634 [Pelomyxa schiedti]